MWILVTIFIGSMEENASVEHIGSPFATQAACEAQLPKRIEWEIQHMGKDDDGLYVRTEFPQGWVALLRCMYVWK